MKVRRYSWVNSLGLLVLVSAITGCGEQKATFSNVDAGIVKKPIVKEASGDANTKAKSIIGGEPVAQNSDDTNKVFQVEKPTVGKSLGEVSETFVTQKVAPPPSDFVFVVDNSRSMAPLISKFVSGFEAVKAESYPQNARLAVMSTMIGVPGEVTKAAESTVIKSPTCLSTVVNYEMNVLNAEPGFLRFMKKGSIDLFQQKISSFKSYLTTFVEQNMASYLRQVECTIDYEEVASEYFRTPLCDSEWFLPSDKNSQGASCLKAAMQISGLAFIEAGLTAISQMMQKNVGKALFRDSAAVHFVFISDTHDPGYASSSVQLPKPATYAEIDTAVRANSKVSSVKLHGVVPFRQCGPLPPQGEGTHDFSYLTQVQASGGVYKDSCEGTADYTAIVNQIFAEAKKIPPFKLKVAQAGNVSVKVNGKVWPDFALINGNSVEVNNMVLSQENKVDISYSIIAK